MQNTQDTQNNTQKTCWQYNKYTINTQLNMQRIFRTF
jgi:hypothetical protein